MHCPAFQELEEYAMNRGAGTPRAELVEHLSNCVNCQSRLHDVEANLRVTPSLRALAERNAGAFEAAPPESIGGYRILRELGRGGMGVVYLARQQRSGVELALKIIRPDVAAGGGGRDTWRRFEQEATVLAQLRHPGIARIIDAGIAEVVSAGGVIRQPYLAIEYVGGERLDEYARMRGLDLPARLQLLAKTADAIHHAHVKGVIHRDLKPSNILVEERAGEPGQPRILDFGVARIVTVDRQAASWATDEGKILGTIPYMSPEQIAADPSRIDARCDVYALGVIGFELLSGQLPYALEGLPLIEAARVIREQPPRRLGVIDRGLRGDVETIIAKALEKEPERRYQSAAEFANDVRRFLRHEPITARPATAIYHLRSFARRNRGLVTGAAMALLALVVGVGATLWQATEARRAADDAQAQLAESVRQSNFLLNTVAPSLQATLGAPQLSESIALQVLESSRELALLHPEDLLVQQRIWESLRYLAALSIGRGESDCALELMRESHDLVSRAVERHPERSEVRFQLAYSSRYLGSALAPFDPSAADASVRESLQTIRRLVEDEPHEPRYRYEFAGTLMCVAHIERRRGDFEEAGRLLREAHEQGRLLSERHHDFEATRLLPAAIAMQLSSLSKARGRLAESEAWIREALTIQEAREHEVPMDRRPIEGAAASHTALAKFALARGDAGAAMKHGLKALQRRELLASVAADSFGASISVANALELLARAAGAAGDTEQARPWAVRELDTLRRIASMEGVPADVLATISQRFLDVAPIDLREPDAALAIAQRAVDLDGADAAVRFALARAQHSAGEMEEAMVTLRTAIDLLPADHPAHASFQRTLAEWGG